MTPCRVERFGSIPYYHLTKASPVGGPGAALALQGGGRTTRVRGQGRARAAHLVHAVVLRHLRAAIFHRAFFIIVSRYPGDRCAGLPVIVTRTPALRSVPFVGPHL